MIQTLVNINNDLSFLFNFNNKNYILKLLETEFGTNIVEKLICYCIDYKYFNLYKFLLIVYKSEFNVWEYINKNEDDEKYLATCLRTLSTDLIFETFILRPDIEKLYLTELDLGMSILGEKNIIEHLTKKDPNFINNKFIRGPYMVSFADYIDECIELYDCEKFKLILDNLNYFKFNWNTIIRKYKIPLLEHLKYILKNWDYTDENHIKNLNYAIEFINSKSDNSSSLNIN
jgi:hypothetical protein